jgi:hypothetical protein
MKTRDEIESNFTFADYSVFASMLCVSTAIGIYFAFKVSNHFIFINLLLLLQYVIIIIKIFSIFLTNFLIIIILYFIIQ